MELDRILESILSEQSPAGAFRAVVEMGGCCYDDWNGFTTADMLRELHCLPDSPQLPQAARRLRQAFLQEGRLWT